MRRGARAVTALTAARIRKNIQRRCAGKWPDLADRIVGLCLAVADLHLRRDAVQGRYIRRTYRVVRAWQSGECSLLLLRDIARALDCSMDDLLAEDGG
jgi:hypothetical protein